MVWWRFFCIEFWGDTIESIRLFDPVGQKSIETVEQVVITAAKEMELIQEQKELSLILDYLGPNTLIVFDDLLALEDRFAELSAILGKPTKQFSSLEQFLQAVEPLQKLFWSKQPIEKLFALQTTGAQENFYSEAAPMIPVTFEVFNRSYTAKRWKNPFFSVIPYLLPDLPENSDISIDEILLSLSRLKEEKLYFLCATEAEQTAIHKQLVELEITLPPSSILDVGYLSSGFYLQDTNTLVIPTTELTHRYKIRRQKLRSTYHTTPSEVHDLTPGEIVVHLNNGIGKFLGLEKRPNNQGIESEFFLIEYADQAKLYVPIHQAHLISKYIGANENIPKLHTLGSARWKRAKETTERAILGFASELLQTRAKREVTGGFSFPEDSVDIQAFEEEFPYAETEDQLLAVAAIKKDMQSAKAMDRLVCGDVGYGKTEVAMRAAFKAVVDGGKLLHLIIRKSQNLTHRFPPIK